MCSNVYGEKCTEMEREYFYNGQWFGKHTLLLTTLRRMNKMQVVKSYSAL